MKLLNRDGVLVRSNADFKLNIDKKPFDVLLTTLPWNISMIQTSFMKNRILKHGYNHHFRNNKAECNNLSKGNDLVIEHIDRRLDFFFKI